MKQQVLNYERDVIHKQVTASAHLPKYDPCNYRYGVWELYETLDQIVEVDRKYQVKWIGNSINGHILGFFYCVLVGSLRDGDEDMFMKVKYALYGVCRDWLTVSEQKTLVEHLGLVQHSKSVTQFLKKSNHLENILIKIFAAFKRELRDKHHKTQPRDYPPKLTKLQQLQQYAILFPFIQFQTQTQKATKLIVNDQQYHIVEQKDCIFVVEYEEGLNIQKVQGEIEKTNKKRRKMAMASIVEEDEGESSRKLVFPNKLIHSVGFPPTSPTNMSQRQSRYQGSKESSFMDNDKYTRSQRMSLAKAKTALNTTPEPFKTHSPNESLRSSFKPFERTSIRIEKDIQNTYSFLEISPTEPVIKIVEPEKVKPHLLNNPRKIKQEKNHRSLESKEKKIVKKASPKVPNFLKQKKEAGSPNIPISPQSKRSSKEKQSSFKKYQQQQQGKYFFPKQYHHKNIQKQQHKYQNRQEYKEHRQPVIIPLTNISSERLLNFKVSHQTKFK